MYYTDRIENLRIDADKTQQQIADVLICQREVYRRYEKGNENSPFGLPLNWLSIMMYP